MVRWRDRFPRCGSRVVLADGAPAASITVEHTRRATRIDLISYQDNRKDRTMFTGKV